jgi:hypothetical protein
MKKKMVDITKQLLARQIKKDYCKKKKGDMKKGSISR